MTSNHKCKILERSAILLAIALATIGCPLRCDILAAFTGDTWQFQNAQLIESITFNANGTMIDNWEPIPGVPRRIEATWEACRRGRSNQGTLVLMVTYDGIPDDENSVVDPPQQREWPYQFLDENRVQITNGKLNGAVLEFQRPD